MQTALKRIIPPCIQAHPGLAAAPPVLRAQQAVLQAQDGRLVQAPRQMEHQVRGPSSSNRPRPQRHGQASLGPLLPLGPNSNPQLRARAWAWAWGRARPNQGRWDQQVEPWAKPDRRVQQEPHHQPW